MPGCSAWLGFSSLAGGRRFGTPSRVEQASRLEDVVPCLLRVEQAVAAGLFAVGFVGYEAAPAFDEALPSVRTGSRFPLLWFGLFPPEECADASWDDVVAGSGNPSPPPARLEWRANLGRARYDTAIADARRCISEGWTYQVNFALRLRAPLPLQPEGALAGPSAGLGPYFGSVLRAQACGYGAFVDCGAGHRVYSASPELFFRWDAQSRLLETRPMKGTARRGADATADEAQLAALLSSEKDRAENVMIVDLLRNDVARVCEAGSVRCTQLCAAEAFPTVYQLTSTVRGQTRPGVGVVDIFRSLFPCGSITGAPKVSTMRIIARLEAEPREAYCGAIGFFAPGGAAEFSVAIRTIVEHEAACACSDADAAGGGRAVYGVGGGVTWSSDAAGEYDEVWAKAAVLERAGAAVNRAGADCPPASLLETLRLCGGCGRFALLWGHLERLGRSASKLGVRIDAARVLESLASCARAAVHAAPGSLDASGPSCAACATAPPLRVRLVVRPDGSADAAPAIPIPPLPGCSGVGGAAGDLPPPAVLSALGAVASGDAALRVKTTARGVYEAARAAAPPSAADVLLVNELGEATEFTVGNAFFLMDDAYWGVEGGGGGVRLVTPPLRCGVLPGVLRTHVLAGASAVAEEEGEEGAGPSAAWDEAAVAALDAGARHGAFDARPPGGLPCCVGVVTAAQVRAGLVRRCWLANSVRGWVEVALAGPEAGAGGGAQ